jgi:hypothetical protein
MKRGAAFAAVEADARASGARNPAAVAAAAGRRKLGQAEMTRRSAAGRNRAGSPAHAKRFAKRILGGR